MADSKTYLKPEVLARIASLGLRAQRVVEGTVAGQHLSPYHGVSIDFSDYREYAPGDDIKRLDWRVFGRTNRFFIKLYEEESNLRVTILMDASASMAYGSGAMTKFDYGATVAASMSAMLIRQQDAVGLALFDRENRIVLRPRATGSQQVEIVNALAAAKPERETDVGEIIWSLADKLQRRGLIIIVSDLLTDLDRLRESLGRLQYQGHEIILFHILDNDELELPFEGSVVFRDIEGQEEIHAEPWAFRKDYCEAMEAFIDEIRRHCRWRGIDYVLLKTKDDLGLALSHYLHWRHRRIGRGRKKAGARMSAGPRAGDR